MRDKSDGRPSGTIRAREARDVLVDILRSAKIPASCYSFRSGAVHILVGGRVVQIGCKSGLSFYGLQAACRDFHEARKHRDQIDIEELINGAA